MNKNEQELPIVLKLRTVERMWTAYVTFPNHPQAPDIMLGSIAMGAIINNEQRKNAFKNLMIAAMKDLVEEIMGERPHAVVERPAPRPQ